MMGLSELTRRWRALEQLGWKFYPADAYGVMCGLYAARNGSALYYAFEQWDLRTEMQALSYFEEKRDYVYKPQAN